MKRTNLSFVVVGSICGSFLVNAAMLACGNVKSYPDAGQAQADAMAGGATVPPGMIVAFGGSVPPEGWLLCDGHPVSRNSYSALFGAIGDAWGKGDSVTTFNLPDLRGRFLRGTDSGAGRDPDVGGRVAINPGGNTGDNVGSVQGDSFQGHAHAINSMRVASIDNSFGAERIGQSTQNSTPFRMVSDAIIADATHGNPRISIETRPQNANVNYIIKI